jgi:hypothetical protein
VLPQIKKNGHKIYQFWNQTDRAMTNSADIKCRIRFLIVTLSQHLARVKKKVATLNGER